MESFMEGAKKQIAKKAIFSFNSRSDDDLDSSDWSSPHKEGFMFKAGGLNTSMKRRFFILQHTRMFYFETGKTKDVKPLGSFSLVDSIVQIEDFATMTFTITTETRTWKLQCSSQEEMQSWINAIQKCAAKDLNFGGASLKRIVQRSLNAGSSEAVPTIVRRCINFLRFGERIRTEGLFRLSGDLKQLKALKNMLDVDENTPHFDQFDVHVIANIFKVFIRELSEPLLTWVLMDEWIACADIDDETVRVSELQRIAVCLPHFNRETMRVISVFLKEVADLCMFNRMTISNLSVIFGPCFLPLQGDHTNGTYADSSKDVFLHAEKQVTLTRDFITFHSLIFSPLPLDDPRGPVPKYVERQLPQPIPITQNHASQESQASSTGSGGSGSFKRPRADRFYKAGTPPVGGWIKGVGSPASPSNQDAISASSPPMSQHPKAPTQLPATGRGSESNSVASGIAKFGGSGSPSIPKRSAMPPTSTAGKVGSPAFPKKSAPILPPKPAPKVTSQRPTTTQQDNLRLNTVAPMRRRPMSILMHIPPTQPGGPPSAAGRPNVPRTPKLWPRLLRVTEEEDQLLAEALPVSCDSVCSEDCFIFDNEVEVIAWYGVKSNDVKRARAAAIHGAITRDRQGSRIRSTVLEQGIHSDTLFFDKLGGRPSYLPDTVSINVESTTPSLFLLSASSGTAEMTQLAVGDGRLRRAALHQSEVYLIDIGFELFIWIGKDSSPVDSEYIPIFTKEYIDSFAKPTGIHISYINQSQHTESNLLQLYLS